MLCLENPRDMCHMKMLVALMQCFLLVFVFVLFPCSNSALTANPVAMPELNMTTSHFPHYRTLLLHMEMCLPLLCKHRSV